MKFTPKVKALTSFTDSFFQKFEEDGKTTHYSVELHVVASGGRIVSAHARASESGYVLNARGTWENRPEPTLHVLVTGSGTAYSPKNDTDYREVHIGGPYNWRRLGDPESMTVWRELRQYPEANLADWTREQLRLFADECLSLPSVDNPL